MYRLITILVGLSAALLAGCSHHMPLEIDAAEDAVISAYRAGASRTAAELYQQANESLDRGKKLAGSGDREEARSALLDAIRKGHQAEINAYSQQLESTEKQLDSAEEYILRLEEQRNVYFKALSKIYDQQKLNEIGLTENRNSYQPSSSYRVRRGENLFAIAAHRKVYGDALLWPLIYKANRDQIKDPQQIYPGQVLTIPRDVSDEEKEQARATARESKIFQQPASSNGKK